MDVQGYQHNVTMCPLLLELLGLPGAPSLFVVCWYGVQQVRHLPEVSFQRPVVGDRVHRVAVERPWHLKAGVWFHTCARPVPVMCVWFNQSAASAWDQIREELEKGRVPGKSERRVAQARALHVGIQAARGAVGSNPMAVELEPAGLLKLPGVCGVGPEDGLKTLVKISLLHYQSMNSKL